MEQPLTLAEQTDLKVTSIMDQIDKVKEEAEAKKLAIKYNRKKPKSSMMATPILESFFPKMELAE